MEKCRGEIQCGGVVRVGLCRLWDIADKPEDGQRQCGLGEGHKL